MKVDTIKQGSRDDITIRDMRIVDVSNFQTFTAINLSSDPGAIGGPTVIPSCAQIRLRWQLADGKGGFNILYGRYSGTFAGSVAQANAIQTALGSGAQWTALAGFLGSTVAFFGVGIKDVNTPNNAEILSSGASVPGTSAGTALPSEVAAVLTLRTAQTGRAFRGRAYIPGWASNAVATGDLIAAAAVTALTNWGGTIPTAFSNNGYTMVLGQKARAAYVSPSTGVSHPARAANSVPITQVLCRDNHWDSQRRRGLR